MSSVTIETIQADLAVKTSGIMSTVLMKQNMYKAL